MSYALPAQASELQLDVAIGTELVIGVSCFNEAVREQLKEAQDEVHRLIEADHVLLVDNDNMSDGMVWIKRTEQCMITC
jgi:hypothetical protein